MEASKLQQKIEDGTYNLIACINTPWQAKGVEAAIDYLKNVSEIRPIIILFEHNITGRCVTKHNFSEKMQKYDYISVKEWRFPEGKNRILRFFKRVYSVIRNKNDEPVYILNPGKLNYKWARYINHNCKRNFKYFLLDDGSGGYCGYSSNDPVSRPYGFEGIFYKFCLNNLKKKDLFVDFRLLSESHNGLVINSAAVEFYRNNLLYISNNLENKKLYSCFCGKIIVNTQPFTENGMIDKQEDIEILSVLSEILGENNDDVILKLHPRENNPDRYKMLKWNIYSEHTIPQEEIIASLEIKPKCIIGINSSSLINSQALFGIKPVCLIKMIMKNDLPAETKKSFKNYIKKFHNVMYMPENREELEQILNYILR